VRSSKRCPIVRRLQRLMPRLGKERRRSAGLLQFGRAMYWPIGGPGDHYSTESAGRVAQRYYSLLILAYQEGVQH